MKKIDLNILSRSFVTKKDRFRDYRLLTNNKRNKRDSIINNNKITQQIKQSITTKQKVYKQSIKLTVTK